MDYVCGFMFNHTLDRVVLIEKRNPAWQRGRFNGVGGKIEANESPLNAMRREFREEAGFDSKRWQEFCVLSGADWTVHFFYFVIDAIAIETLIESKTDERILVEDVPHNKQRLPNLEWLIPMAIATAKGEDCCRNFDVRERVA